jgi:hypothetical protein
MNMVDKKLKHQWEKQILILQYVLHNSIGDQMSNGLHLFYIQQKNNPILVK